MRSRRNPVIAVMAALSFLVPSVALAQPAGAAPGLPILVYADGQHHVFVADLDGAGARQVLNNADQPVVSPDGTTIAFVDSSTGHLGFAASDGSARRVMPYVAVPSSWTTDGSTLAVSSASRIGTVNTATGVVRLFDDANPQFDPEISPDNSLISSFEPEETGPVETVRRIDGSTPIVRSPGAPGVFSPNGAYRLRQVPPYAVDRLEFVVNSTGSGVRSWGGTIPTSLVNSPNTLGGAAFSPDSGTAYIGARFFLQTKDTFDLPRGIYTSTLAHPEPTLLISNAWYPSIGGGQRPADTNGPPPAVTDLVAHVSDNALALSWTGPTVSDGAGVDVRASTRPSFPATATDGSDWGRLLDQSLTRGKLPPDTTFSVSVFSRDWFGNVGPAAHIQVVTPHQSLTSLSGGAAPFDLRYGAHTRITGTVVRSFDGSGIAGARLDVSRRVLGATTPFTHIGFATTDSLGRYSLTQIPLTSYYYRISLPASRCAARCQRRRSRQSDARSLDRCHGKPDGELPNHPDRSNQSGTGERLDVPRRCLHHGCAGQRRVPAPRSACHRRIRNRSVHRARPAAWGHLAIQGGGAGQDAIHRSSHPGRVDYRRLTSQIPQTGRPPGQRP